MYRIIQGVLILSAVVFLSCSDEDVKHSRKKPRLNIAGASSIVVYDGSSNSGGRIRSGEATDETNLYKITTDGNVEEVKFVNEDGTDVDPNATHTQVYVSAVYDVNEEFVILNGSFRAWDTLGNARGFYDLLVRKSDGAIFDFSFPPPNISTTTSFGEKVFQSDSNGNFYYLNNQGEIIKINTTNPDNLSRVSYLPSGQYAYSFGVDNDGNCVYVFYNGSYGTRIRKKNGGIFEFPSDSISKFWKGVNGNIYFTSYTRSGLSTIKKLEVDENSNVSSSVVWTDPNPPQGLGVNSANRYIKIPKANSVVFIGTDGGETFEFNENDGTVTYFTLPYLRYTAKVIYSQEYYYISDGTKLYRASLADHSYVSVFPPGQFEIYTMNVDRNDVLQISALRFSDGKKIIAEINLQNEIRIVEEEKDQDVLYLQRLN